MPIFKVEEIVVFQIPISSEGLMRDRPEYNWFFSASDDVLACSIQVEAQGGCMFKQQNDKWMFIFAEYLT